MFFNTENLNPFTKFYFNEKKPEIGWIELRVLDGKKGKELKNKYEKTRFEFKRKQRYEVTYIKDQDAYDKEMWDYCIGEWLVYSEPGKEMENSPENKLTLMNESPQFAGFVGKCLEQLNDAIQEHEENTEKN